MQCVANEKPAYVTIKIANKKVAETAHEHDRIWNQTFQILCAHPSDTIITIALKTRCSIQGLKNATFPQRSNCSVTLYQDAHHCASFQPPSALSQTPKKLWEDVYKAIEGAKHLVYIAGWSLNPKIILVRDPNTEIPHARGVKLGELLKRKAAEGVAVRILLWDDETSLPIIKNQGVMKTHDEDSLAYFKHTKVICKLCPRLHDKFPTVFSHHQKTITVDTRVQQSSTNREILSFIGGLDLCDGRYDTQDHSLFKTLNTEAHCYDFYQTSISGASLHKGGPREPWHDTHACITGQAALDVLTNFEQRWTKQFEPSLLVPLSSIPELSNQHSTTISSERDWNVQVFRSIDHVSAIPLPRNMSTERSIHEAYVEAIRRADRFIYIENQYFLGGCHLWEKDQQCGCRNLIPVEIALKVANKIKAKQRFAVYMVIPMWPEGAPESESVHDILHWSRETMKMMHKLIAEALEESGEPGHPRDYLNFFCLANRENEVKGEFVPPYSPHPETHYWNAQKQRRFMVYVHSKLMIVDDTYMLIGSANVNQRSMDGKRDTEIAIGCYRSKSSEERMDRGDIHAFRLSLWYEHTGQAEEVFQDPRSLECVQRIRSIGEQMWEVYSADEVVDMKRTHLLTYPVNVTKEGCVQDLAEGNYHFPDTRTPIKGKRSKFLSPVFTT